MGNGAALLTAWWLTATSTRVISSIAGRDRPAVIVLDADSGEHVWSVLSRADLESRFLESSGDASDRRDDRPDIVPPAVVDDLLVTMYSVVYEVRGQSGDYVEWGVLAFSLADGTVRWHRPRAMASLERPSIVVGTGAAVLVGFMNSDDEGWILTLDAATGDEWWRLATGGQVVQAIAVDSTVFALTHDGSRVDRVLAVR